MQDQSIQPSSTLDETDGLAIPVRNDKSTTTPKVTLFAVPKAFNGHTGVIQRNAILSWKKLAPAVEILLIGDDDGVAEFAKDNAIPHSPTLDRSDDGTPLLDGIFQTAYERSNADWLMYINCDIILSSEFQKVVKLIQQNVEQDFLAIGQRFDFDQEEEIEFVPDWESNLIKMAKKNGRMASILCKDYFLFPREQYRDIPAFRIGRGNWDSWMVATAVNKGLPVLDLTEHVFAGHQNHDHAHVGGRMKAYVSGKEAKENLRLSTSTHYVKGSVATHRITKEGDLKRVNRFRLLSFLFDLPRITRLLIDMVRK